MIFAKTSAGYESVLNTIESEMHARSRGATWHSIGYLTEGPSKVVQYLHLFDLLSQCIQVQQYAAEQKKYAPNRAMHGMTGPP